MLKKIIVVCISLVIILTLFMPITTFAANDDETAFDSQQALSKTRGKDGFYYFAYDPIKKQWEDLSFDITNWRWTSKYPTYEKWLVTTGSVFHPSIREVVVGWVAPADGRVYEEGNVFSKGNGFDGKGNGVKIKILLNETVIWPKSAADCPYGMDGDFAKLPKNIAPNVNKIIFGYDVQVKTGDFIYYVVDSNGDATAADSSDAVEFKAVPTFVGTVPGTWPVVPERKLSSPPYSGQTSTLISNSTSTASNSTSTTSSKTSSSSKFLSSIVGSISSNIDMSSGSVTNSIVEVVSQDGENKPFKAAYTDILINYSEKQIQIDNPLSIEELSTSFTFKSGYTIKVVDRDGNDIADKSTKVTNDDKIQLLNAQTVEDTYALIIKNNVAITAKEEPANNTLLFIILGIVAVIIGGGIAAIMIIKKKKA